MSSIGHPATYSGSFFGLLIMRILSTLALLMHVNFLTGKKAESSSWSMYFWDDGPDLTATSTAQEQRL